jgi:hypothetical protein
MQAATEIYRRPTGERKCHSHAARNNVGVRNTLSLIAARVFPLSMFITKCFFSHLHSPQNSRRVLRTQTLALSVPFALRQIVPSRQSSQGITATFLLAPRVQAMIVLKTQDPACRIAGSHRHLRARVQHPAAVDALFNLFEEIQNN